MTHRLVLRTSNKDGKAHGGFQWPASGMVECPDWKDNQACGNGLHGILWPEGDWSDIKEYDEELWQVVRVLASDLVKLDGKVKFPRGEVVYSGNLAVAFNMVAKSFVEGIPAMLEEAKKDGTPEAVSSGDYAQLAASGDYAQLAASGDSAKLAASGHSAKLAASGDSAKLAASGHSAKLAASGHSAKLAASGDYAAIDSTGKDAVIACAVAPKKFKAGAGGCISAPWHDGTRMRFAVGYVGENIVADVWYSVSDAGEFVKVRK